MIEGEYLNPIGMIRVLALAIDIGLGDLQIDIGSHMFLTPLGKKR
jgi:hypothetical protein